MSSLISFSSCDFLKYFPSTLTRISLEFASLGSAAGLAMESGDVGCAWLAASLFFSSLLPQPNMTTTTNITYTAIHFFLFLIFIKFLPIIIGDDFSITKYYMQNAYLRQEDNPDPLYWIYLLLCYFTQILKKLKLFFQFGNFCLCINF